MSNWGFIVTLSRTDRAIRFADVSSAILYNAEWEHALCPRTKWPNPTHILRLAIIQLIVCSFLLVTPQSKTNAQSTAPGQVLIEDIAKENGEYVLRVQTSRPGVHHLEFSSDLNTWSSMLWSNVVAPGQLLFKMTEPRSGYGFFRINLQPELLLRFKEGVEAESIEDILDQASLVIEGVRETDAMVSFGTRRILVARTELPWTEQALQILHTNAAVEFAEANAAFTIQSEPDDPRCLDGSQWGMYGASSDPRHEYGIDAIGAWSDGYTGSQDVCVGIVDTGIQYSHPDLSVNVWTNPREVPGNGIDDDGNGTIDDVHGWNFAGDNPEVDDEFGHGTHVAGIIGCVGNNALGFAGVNWAVTMIPAKHARGRYALPTDAIDAIDYLVNLKQSGLRIVAINTSWSGAPYSTALHESILRAAKSDILVVASSGNSGLSNDERAIYPANYDTMVPTAGVSAADYNAIISVAAYDEFGNLATFSNYGRLRVHIAAPGSNVWSTWSGSTYEAASGTSMAAPHVTGAAALYAARYTNALAKDIRNAILSSAVPTPSLQGKTIRGGRLNVRAALNVPPGRSQGGSLAAPSNLQAAWNLETGSVLVSWQDNSTNELGFAVERSVNNGPFQPFGGRLANVTQLIDRGTEGASTYAYRVKAWNGEGSSEWSSMATATVLIPPPTEVKATLTSVGNVRVVWRNNCRGLASFEIERSTDNTQFKRIASIVPLSDTGRTTDKDVLVGKSYYYRIRAVQTGTPSKYSETVAISLLAEGRPVPAAPECGMSGVRRAPVFGWTGVLGATQYRFQLAVDSPGKLVPDRGAVVTNTAHSISETNLLHGNRQYYWRVRAEGYGTEGVWSDWCGFFTAFDPPELETPPSGISGISTTPSFTWHSVVDASRYVLQLAMEDTSTLAATHEVSGTIYTTTPAGKLKNNTDYFWRVKAQSAANDGAWSEWFPFRTHLAAPSTELPVCGDPCVRRATSFSWSPVTGAEKYHFQLAADTPENPVSHREAWESVPTHSIDETNMLRGYRQYYWRVRAQSVNNQGAWSPWCGFVTAFDPPDLLAPSCGATNVARTPSFRWNAVPGASHCRWQIKDNQGKISERVFSGTSQIIPSENRLNSMQLYSWRVRAETSGNEGAWTDWCAFTTRP